MSVARRLQDLGLEDRCCQSQSCYQLLLGGVAFSSDIDKHLVSACCLLCEGSHLGL